MIKLMLLRYHLGIHFNRMSRFNAFLHAIRGVLR
jgi:hypothetical protein